MIHVPFSEILIGEEFEVHLAGLYILCVKVGLRTYKNVRSGMEHGATPGFTCWVWEHQHNHAVQARMQNA